MSAAPGMSQGLTSHCLALEGRSPGLQTAPACPSRRTPVFGELRGRLEEMQDPHQQ